MHVLLSRVCSLACSPWCSQSCHFITAGGNKSIPPNPLNSFCVALSVQSRVLATGACVHHMHLSAGAALAPTAAVLVQWQQVSSGDSTSKALCDPGRSGQGDSKSDPPQTQSRPCFCHACGEQYY